MVPAEETLHITLRDSTESAIKKDVEQSHQRSLKSVEKIVENWMAVEEAIVGGIVYRLLPHILEEHITDLSLSYIEMDIRQIFDVLDLVFQFAESFDFNNPFSLFGS